MDYITWTYAASLTISIALTIWVARTFHKNGRVFLVDTFLGNGAIADSVNHLLVVGFYLVNIGYVTLALKRGDTARPLRLPRVSAPRSASSSSSWAPCISSTSTCFPRCGGVPSFATRLLRLPAGRVTGPGLRFGRRSNQRPEPWSEGVTRKLGAPSGRSTPKAEETRRRILAAALDLFQERGFAETTMREIALRAEVATGAAYYYFPSKEAIVMAFYWETPLEFEATSLRTPLAGVRDLGGRIRMLVERKLDQFGPYREFFGALFRSAGDPASPLSPFSEETREIREQSIAHFRLALRGLRRQGSAGPRAASAVPPLALPDGRHHVLDLRSLGASDPDASPAGEEQST